MTIITIDDELINEIIAVSHYKNPQEAVIKILSNYLQQQKKELPLFERLRFIDDESAEDDIASLFERVKQPPIAHYLLYMLIESREKIFWII
jgi:Bacterial antitoxin of type II TA system, VapB